MTALYRRQFLTGGLAAAAAGLAAPSRLFAAAPDDAILATVHPELRDMARLILQAFGNQPPLSLATLAQQRRGMAGFAGKPLAGVPVEKRTVPGSRGQPDVALYVVNRKAGGARPAILHTHGGGYVSGGAELSVPDLQKLCQALDCMGVSVDYRLAPETTYAGSIEDNYAGLKWLHANAAELGVDPARIAVMGESAGGGHAALLAITARDRGEVPVCFQCLIYPMLDDRTGTTRSVPPHVGRIIWTAEANRFGWESFLGTRPGGRRAPRGAVPARVENLAGLPPAFIGVGTIDLFCDEDIEYAQRLNAARVPVELNVVPGAFHGFDAMPMPARVSQTFNAAKLDALRRGLGIAASAPPGGN